MSQLFNTVKVAGSKRSTFDLSHHQVTTSDFGFLTPICMRHMVPNDDFVVKPNVFCRLSPLAVPTYGRITARIHHFFVPYRVLYPKWDMFITQDKNNFTVPPYLTASVLTQAVNADSWLDPTITTGYRGMYCRLMSNLGIDPRSLHRLLPTTRFNMFPFLAYYRIWLDYFCDPSINDHPSLEQAFNDLIADGGNLYSASLTVTDLLLKTKNVCYKKDYFTTARLNPQEGHSSLVGVDIAGNDLNPGLHVTSSTTGIQTNGIVVHQNHSAGASSATSKIGQFTIEALRAANSLQRYLERNNYVGSKIINRILAHFGIAPSAERLDMAEFIGGDSFPIQIGDVTSTSVSSGFDGNDNLVTSSAGLGYQAGKGVGAGSSKEVRYHAKEHGVFMTLMSIVPDTGYYQGISRFWQKGVYGDALDFFTPEFENLGYQELLNREVFVPPFNQTTYNDYEPDEIFGYTPRFSEYKFQNDVLAGDILANSSFNSGGRARNFLGDSWHLFRHLRFTDENPLALNNNFVELDNKNNDYDRIFQYTDNNFDHFYFNIDMDVKATRPMTGFSEPSLDTNNSGDGNSVDLPYGGTRL